MFQILRLTSKFVFFVFSVLYRPRGEIRSLDTETNNYETEKVRRRGHILMNNLGPVVQSIVSLTSSLCGLHYQIHVRYYFLLEKCEDLLQCKRFSHFFQQKNFSVFVIFT